MRRGLVTARRLNVRLTPSTREAPVGQLDRGDSVEILGSDGPWYRVRLPEAPEGEAFVHGDFVRVLDHEPASGFLREREELTGAALDPSPEERIEVASGAPAGDRALARTWNRYGRFLSSVSDALDLDVATGVAVLDVESGGTAFGADGRLVIRFENHVFWRRWGREHPDAFGRHFSFDPRRTWQGHRMRTDPSAAFESFHGRQSGEWKAFELARSLHEGAALLSISMGLPQIMGFNHARLGYGTPKAMFDRFSADVRSHLVGLFDFIKGSGATSSMLEALRTRRFEDFATRYNGRGQAARYGGLVAARVKRFGELRDRDPR